MTRLFGFVSLLVLGACTGTAQVKAPPIGIARLADTSVRALYGLPSNVIVDPTSVGSFDAASFSDQVGLLAKKGRIKLVGANFALLGEFNTSEPHPLLNVDGAASSAVVWLPASQSLLHWNGDGFVSQTVTGLDPSLQVTSVRMQGEQTAQLLLTDSKGSVLEANVSLESGNIASLKPLPGITGSPFWQGSAILFHDANGLEAVTPDGVVRMIAINAEDLSFEHISSDWVLLTSTSMSRTWALRIVGPELQISDVPGTSTKALEAMK